MNYEFLEEETMKTTLRSRDLSCPSCIQKIESALRRLNGVSEAKVYFNSGRIVVEHDQAEVDVEALQRTVRDIGYETQTSAL